VFATGRVDPYDPILPRLSFLRPSISVLILQGFFHSLVGHSETILRSASKTFRQGEYFFFSRHLNDSLSVVVLARAFSFFACSLRVYPPLQSLLVVVQK
jgi:hypothetical protein